MEKADRAVRVGPREAFVPAFVRLPASSHFWRHDLLWCHVEACIAGNTAGPVGAGSRRSGRAGSPLSIYHPAYETLFRLRSLFCFSLALLQEVLSPILCSSHISCVHLLLTAHRSASRGGLLSSLPSQLWLSPRPPSSWSFSADASYSVHVGRPSMRSTL